ncbi:MAG: hypothetical protein ACHWZW_19070 [Spirulina sp.]
MMNRGTSAPSKPQAPLWQRLIAPMLLASLGLHGLILLVPTGASQDAAIPPPDPEQDSVAITRIPPTNPAEPDGDDVAATRPPMGQTPPGQSPAAPVGGIARIQRPTTGSTAGSSARSTAASQPTSSRTPSRTASRQSGRSSSPSRSQANTPAPGSASGADRPASPAPASPTPQPSAPPVSATPAPTTNSQPLTPSDLRAQLQAYAAELNLPQGRIDRLAANLRQRFSYNAAASAEEVLPINQTQWQDQIRQATGLADLTATPLPDPLAMVYRQRVCLTPAPGPVKVGLLANPDGTQAEDPVVLQSSGYGAVDTRAIRAATDHTLPRADQPKAYILTVDPEVDPGRTPCLDPNAAS